MLFQEIIFWFLAVAAIGGSLGVVLVKDLFRAALLLVVVFIAVAGFFIMLSAEFLAVVQVLIYAGAIAILIIFAIMLTRDVGRGNLPNQLQVPAAVFAALLLAALVVVATATDWNLISEEDQEQQQRVELVQTRAVSTLTDESLQGPAFPTPSEKAEVQEAGLADLLLRDFVLPFEVVSVLLLAAVIGALALVRER
jgi:NADH-quinone oxidoreductase subunit J